MKYTITATQHRLDYIMSKSKTAFKKIAGDNLRVRLILNNDEGVNRASMGTAQAQARRAKVFQEEKVEYTYRVDRIIAVAVMVILVLVGVIAGVRAFLHSEPTTQLAETIDQSAVAATVVESSSAVVASSHNVVRTLLSSGVQQEAPKGIINPRGKQTFVSLKKLPNRYLYFFTDVKDLTGATLYHTWKYKGDVVARIKMNKVGDALWRSYSGKLMRKKQLGSWEVTLSDEKGTALASKRFVLVK